METLTETTPAQEIPFPDVIGIAAAGIGILWTGRMRKE
jgi:hypothetical protein